MDRRQQRDRERPEREDEYLRREEPRSMRDFERVLAEEADVSTEFDLPLCVLVVRLQDRVPREDARRVVAVLRAGDLIAQPKPREISVALPNTEFTDAGVVERRLRETLPGAAVGIAVHRAGDTVPELLGRARGALVG